RKIEPTYNFELEDLVSTAKVLVGEAGPQDMKSFGPGWSGNAQLFWKLGPCGTPIGGGSPYTHAGGPFTPGPSLIVSFDVATPGVYEIALHYTKGPDFGMFSWSFDNGANAAGL